VRPRHCQAFRKLETLDLRHCQAYGVQWRVVLHALRIAGVHRRPVEARLRGLYLAGCASIYLDRGVLDALLPLVSLSRRLDADGPTSLRRGPHVEIDVDECVFCDHVVAGDVGKDYLRCSVCASASCRRHRQDNEDGVHGVQLCDLRHCGAFVCLVGDCAEYFEPWDVLDDNGDPMCVCCDECGRWYGLAENARHMVQRILNPRLLSYKPPWDMFSTICQAPRGGRVGAARPPSRQGPT